MTSTQTAAWRTLAAGALCLHTAFAAAATLHVQVVDQSGAPVSDAVVYATPASGKLPPAKPANAVIDQVKRMFVPHISVVQTGTAVTFPNKDNFEHDVYSFSPAKPFELHLYHNTPAKPVVFDKPGVVLMGCNIHDTMVAYLLVVDTPWFAKTDAKGVATISDLPADNYKLTTWDERLPSTSTPTVQPVSAGAADSDVHVALQLKAAQ